MASQQPENNAQKSSLPTPFQPNPDDPYIRPKIGEFVSYLYHRNVYRTGIFVTKDGTIRFLEGRNKLGEVVYNDVKFHINKTMFQKGSFRRRPDLTPGR